MRPRRGDRAGDIADRLAAEDQRAGREVDCERQAEKRNLPRPRKIAENGEKPLRRQRRPFAPEKPIEIELARVQFQLSGGRRAEIKGRAGVEIGGKIVADLKLEAREFRRAQRSCEPPARLPGQAERPGAPGQAHGSRGAGQREDAGRLREAEIAVEIEARMVGVFIETCFDGQARALPQAGRKTENIGRAAEVEMALAAERAGQRIGRGRKRDMVETIGPLDLRIVHDEAAPGHRNALETHLSDEARRRPPKRHSGVLKPQMHLRFDEPRLDEINLAPHQCGQSDFEMQFGNLDVHAVGRRGEFDMFELEIGSRQIFRSMPPRIFTSAPVRLESCASTTGRSAFQSMK